MNGARRVLIGAIVGAHGVRGDLRVRTYTQNPEDIAAYGLLSDDRGRRFTLNVLRVLKPGLVLARAAEIATREDAEALAGAALYVDRDALPAPQEDEFYAADLIGLSVYAENGAAVGEVVAVHNFGAGDFIEVSGPAAGFFVPFTRACVPTIDLAARRILISRDCMEAADSPA